jgi:hypothetical protein
LFYVIYVCSRKRKKEKEIIEIGQTQKDKNFSSNEIKLDDSHFNTSSSSSFSHGK